MRADGDGGIVVESAQYRLEVPADGGPATLSSPAGRQWARLRLLAALDCAEGPDETLSVSKPQILGSSTIRIERRSTRWDRADLTLVCGEEGIEFVASVGGRGTLTDAHLLGGRSVMPGLPTGFLPSGSSFRTLFSPNPGDPARVLRSAGEGAVIGAAGDSQPGRGHWFFTPAPLFFALTGAEGVNDPAGRVAAGWVGLAIAAPVADLTFVELGYEPADGGFSLRIDYDGHTRADGEFRTPALVLTPDLPDPYTGLRRQREDLVARGAAPPPRRRETPRWWSAPIFSGWGAQCHLARTVGGRAGDHSTEASYDGFLDHLERQGVVPGTVIVDDKWQATYGTCEPDREKWPDLRRWIAGRRRRGQRVLLWWKAWSAEGLPADLCIRNPDGAPIVLDPTNPAAREAVRGAVRRMLDADGLDADGIKIDFTASTPKGRTLTAQGNGWGIALLHDLLALVYAAAKEAKDDALVMTHTPHPSFADVTDMIRLNDMMRLDDPDPVVPIVPQMRYRAEVVGSACPDVLIDTDDWCVPDRAAWREYLEVKPALGVPSLYYATHLDFTGESLEVDDYEAIRRSWRAWRAKR